jgi:hypothetical protein
MPDKQISALTVGDPIRAGDMLVIARAGQDLKLRPPSLAELAAAQAASGPITASGQRLTALGVPTASDDAATKAYVDSQVVVGSAGTLAAVLAAGNDAAGAVIAGLADPVQETDAATKGYIDSFTFNVRAGVTYTVQAGDQGDVISCVNSGGTTVSFDTDANTGWPAFNPLKAEVVYLRQFGGTVTVQGINGVVVDSRGSIKTLAGSFAWATAVRTGPNHWDLFGDLG